MSKLKYIPPNAAKQRIIITPRDITVDGDIRFDEGLRLLFVAQLQMLNGFYEASTKDIPDEAQKREFKEKLYDLYNENASRILEQFIPDKELRPDLTAEAIMQLENEIILQRAAELKERQALEDELTADDLLIEGHPDPVGDSGPVGDPEDLGITDIPDDKVE